MTAGADGVTVDINAATTIDTLTPTNNVTLDIASGITLTITNTVSVPAGKILTFKGVNDGSAETLTLTGGLTLAGAASELNVTTDLTTAMVIGGTLTTSGYPFGATAPRSRQQEREIPDIDPRFLERRMLNESADQHAALMAARGLALRGGPIVLVILFLFVVTRWWALGILAGTALVITGGEIAIALHIAERGVVRSGLFVGAALLLVVMIAAAIMMEFLAPSANTSLMGWRGGAFVIMIGGSIVATESSFKCLDLPFCDGGTNVMSQWLHGFHRVAGLFLGGGVGFLLWHLWRRGCPQPLFQITLVLAGLVVAQMILGVVAIVQSFPSELRILHVFLATLVWWTLVAIWALSSPTLGGRLKWDQAGASRR
ncbi:MAG: hypothetical protein IIC82_09290 [Chloroflexi bacterium]|nr:hypothetical protein [Chloroflexota bacterium]